LDLHVIKFTTRSDPQGIYGEISAAALLSRCREDLLTGRLLFRHNAIQKEFGLWQGWIISARSNVRSETLSNLLLIQGELKSYQHRRVLEEMSRRNQRQGRLLVEMGVLSESQLKRALEHQIIHRMRGIFAWSDGEYGIQMGSEESEPPELQLDPRRILFESVPLIPVAQLVERFDRRINQYCYPGAEGQPEFLEPGHPAQRVLKLCQGRSLSQILSRSPYTLSETLRWIYALEHCKRIEVKRAPRKQAIRPPKASKQRSRPRQEQRITRPLKLPLPKIPKKVVSAPAPLKESAPAPIEEAKSVDSKDSPLESFPDDLAAEINFFHGREALKRGELERALCFLQLSCKQDPQERRYAIYRCYLNFRIAAPQDHKTRSEIHRQLKSLLLEDPTLDEGFVLLAHIQEEVGQSVQAYRLYRKALSINHSNVEAQAGVERLAVNQELSDPLRELLKDS